MSIEKHDHRDSNREEPKNPVLDYLVEKNKTLVDEYHTPDGNYAESCGNIAVDIAKMLLSSGKRPEIVSITGKRVDNPHIIANEPLKPVQYKGRISWGAHIVCVCEGMVYDPMIGRPLSKEEYAYETFGAEVEMKTIVTEDKIEEFVNR